MSARDDAELRALAERLEFELEFLRECDRHGVALPDESDEAAARLAKLRRLRRLCAGLELDVFAGSIIVDLLEEMDRLRRDLDRLTRGL